MRFGAPEYFLWLWTLVVLLLFFWWAIRHRQLLTRRFSEEKIFSKLAATYDEKNARIKIICVFLFFLFSIFALARPQWGYEMREVKRRGTDILLIIDVSKSMLTKDVKPSRLERTKLAVRDLLKKLKGDRVGLIAFAGDAFWVCPLTVDYNGFLLSLEDLSTQTVPRGGTNIGAALDEALREYESAGGKHKAVVILTDGENLEGDPLSRAAKAKDKGIKIFAIGVGTQEGELIQLPGEDGTKDFLKDSQGNFVKSRLDESLLQKIALSTGGIYVRASGAQFGLDLIYEQEISKFEKKDYQSKNERRYFERFQFPLAIALSVFLFEFLLPTRRRLEDA